MRFALIPIFTLLISGGRLSAQDAGSADKKYAAAIEKADKDRAAAVAAATAEYVRSLKELMAAQTKKGDLDAALATRERIKVVEAGAAPAPAASGANPLAGTSWVTDKGATFEWKPDGTFLHKGGPRPCVKVDATRYVIYFDNARLDLIQFDKELTKFEHWQFSTNGKSLESGKRAGK